MAWYNIFKRAPERSPADEPMSPIQQIGGQKIRILQSGLPHTASYALKHPSVYRVVNKIATSVQSVDWYAEVDAKLPKSEQASATVIKELNYLLQSPNDNWAGEQLRYWIAMNYALYSRVPMKIGSGVKGTPNAIYPLDAQYVSATLNDRGQVSNYKYGDGQTEQTLKTRKQVELAAADGSLKDSYAHEIVIPTLSGTFSYNKGTSVPLQTLKLPMHIITCLLQRAADTAAGHPNMKYVITAEKTLTKPQKEALKQHIEESTPGEEESGSVLFLHNTKIEVHELDNKLEDIHTKIPSDDMTRIIAGVYGVPISLVGLGAADSAKFAGNYKESRLSFWQDTMVPAYLKPIAGGLTQALCPPGAKIMFDLDSVPALWEGRADLGEKLGKVDVLTPTEKREILGFEQLTDEQRTEIEQFAALMPRGNQAEPTDPTQGNE